MTKLNSSELAKRAQSFFSEKPNQGRKMVYMTDDGSIFYEDKKAYADSHAQSIESKVLPFNNAKNKGEEPVEGRSEQEILITDILELIEVKDVSFGKPLTGEKLRRLDMGELRAMKNNLNKAKDKEIEVEVDKKAAKKEEENAKLEADKKAEEEKLAKEKEKADAKNKADEKPEKKELTEEEQAELDELNALKEDELIDLALSFDSELSKSNLKAMKMDAIVAHIIELKKNAESKED